jgi:hypothetical protein
MEDQKEMTVNDTIPSKAELSQSQPTVAAARIHWAETDRPARPELEQQYEAMRSRNWITDRMVQQYQKHWHCSREVALERLVSKAGK